MTKDYTGQRIGNLTLVERLPQYKYGNTYYRCKCDCGNECFISSSEFTSKKRISCGCGSKCKKKDLTGQRFCKLLAVERLAKYKHNATYYRCVCDCGDEKIVRGGDLTKGAVKSCGCYQKDHPSNTANHVGERFGHLTAIERIPDETHQGKTKYRCLCDCGNEVTVVGKQLTAGNKKSCGVCSFRYEWRRGCVYPSLRKDYTGQKFNRLTVLKMEYNTGRGRASRATVRCDCGAIKTINAHYVAYGIVRSCGCLYDDVVHTKDLSGQKFNWLTAVEMVKGENGKLVTDKRNNQMWLCKCDCGNTVEVSSHSLKNNKRQSCGCVSMRKSRYEKIVEEMLTSYGIRFTQQKFFDDCIYERRLPFDFYLEIGDRKICIECQGEQHFRPIPLFGGSEGYEVQKARDNAKYEYCRKNNIELLYIQYYLTREEIEKQIIHTLNLVTTTAV